MLRYERLELAPEPGGARSPDRRGAHGPQPEMTQANVIS